MNLRWDYCATAAGYFVQGEVDLLQLCSALLQLFAVLRDRMRGEATLKDRSPRRGAVGLGIGPLMVQGEQAR